MKPGCCYSRVSWKQETQSVSTPIDQWTVEICFCNYILVSTTLPCTCQACCYSYRSGWLESFLCTNKKSGNETHTLLNFFDFF